MILHAYMGRKRWGVAPSSALFLGRKDRGHAEDSSSSASESIEKSGFARVAGRKWEGEAVQDEKTLVEERAIFRIYPLGWGAPTPPAGREIIFHFFCKFLMTRPFSGQTSRNSPRRAACQENVHDPFLSFASLSAD